MRTAGGLPVPGASVTVRVDLSGGEEAFRAFKAIASLGLGCLDQEGCSTPTAATRTGDDGRFVSRVPSGGKPTNRLVVTVVSPVPGGAEMITSVTYPTSARKGAALGTIVVPVKGVTLGGSGRRLTVSAPVLSGARLDAVTVTMLAASRGPDGRLVAGATLMDASKGFDPLLVEDARVLLRSQARGTIDGRPVVVSGTLLYNGNHVPASRGASCRVTGSRGQAIVQDPCGLTDGDLTHAWDLKDDPRCVDGPCAGTVQNDHRDTYVTFARAIPARLLVVRGCGFTCTVSVTTSRGTRALADPSDFGDVYTADLDGTPLTAVHLRTATGGFVSRLQEVSAFR